MIVYVYDLDRLLPLTYALLSIYIILLVFVLFHSVSAHKTPSFCIEVQILCDTYIPTEYVINYGYQLFL